jgi:hypothetical protein
MLLVEWVRDLAGLEPPLKRTRSYLAQLTCSLQPGEFAIASSWERLFAMEAGGAMAEVGLLPFTRIALDVPKAALPRYGSRFIKHQFTHPQLLAILCLMRYEDWTFREAEVQLTEHRELRQVLGLASVPDFTRGNTQSNAQARYPCVSLHRGHRLN